MNLSAWRSGLGIHRKHALLRHVELETPNEAPALAELSRSLRALPRFQKECVFLAAELSFRRSGSGIR